MADTAEDRSAALAAQAARIWARAAAPGRERAARAVESVLEERSGERHVGEDEEERDGARRDNFACRPARRAGSSALGNE